MAIEAISIENISGSQVIKIPENFKINDNKVYLKKVGDLLYLIPYHNPWKSMVDSLNEFSEDFMDDRNQPHQQARELLD